MVLVPFRTSGTTLVAEDDFSNGDVTQTQQLRKRAHQERSSKGMGPKKSDKKPAKGADGEVQGEDPLQFLQNYQRFSKLIGIAPNNKIVAQLQSDENQPLAQVRVRRQCTSIYAGD